MVGIFSRRLQEVVTYMYENSFTLIYMYILKEIHSTQFLSYNM